MVHKIKTQTEVNYNQDGTVDIILKAVKDDKDCSAILPHILRSLITDNVIVISGATVVEGYLLVDTTCYPEWIDLELDNNTGELFIIYKNPLESEYTIDSDTGSLLFETP